MKIKQLISSIKKRPGMFIKEEKIEYVYYLLSGYCGANLGMRNDSMDQNTNDNMDQKFMLWFGKWLITWIKNNVDDGYSPQTVIWYDDIRRIAKNGQNEYNMFFELCELFFEDYDNKEGYFAWRNEEG